jgi:hypothetical protein
MGVRVFEIEKVALGDPGLAAQFLGPPRSATPGIAMQILALQCVLSRKGSP